LVAADYFDFLGFGAAVFFVFPVDSVTLELALDLVGAFFFAGFGLSSKSKSCGVT